jgi:GNAT superfamily N-acetyltransferase
VTEEPKALPREYAIGLARADEVEFLPSIDEAATDLFPLEDIPLELRGHGGLPLSFFEETRLAGRLWVAREFEAPTPVGFAAAILIDGGAHLYQVSVLPSHGRRGLGRALVLHVASWARQAGLAALTLTTFRHLPFNGPFYEGLGFKPIPVAKQGPEIRAALAGEAERGLDPDKRIAMRWDLGKV